MYVDLWPADEGPSRSPMPASARLARFYRHLLLWVLQAWLAMFYVGAALAKLTQPHDILAMLLGWTARVDPGVVQIVGWAELGLAVGVLTPLASWRIFRPTLLTCSAGLSGDALFMGSHHAAQGHWALAAVNAALMMMAVAVLIGRRFEAVRQPVRA